MLTLSKISAAIIGLSAALVAGCQSTGSSSQSKSTMDEPVALTCSKCQTTYSRVPVTTGGPRSPQVVSYRTVANHECPDCRNAVKNWFTYGKMTFPGQIVHSCKTCGGEVKVCHTEKM